MYLSAETCPEPSQAVKIPYKHTTWNLLGLFVGLTFLRE